MDDFDVDWEMLNEIFQDDMVMDLSASTSNDQALRDMQNALTDEQPAIDLGQGQGPKRFKRVSSEEMEALRDMKQSKSTKNSTKWGVKVFQDWSLETYGSETDLSSISADHLDQRLGKFYAEATPKPSDNRRKQMTVDQASEYHKNSMKSLRSAISRKVRELERDFDIVRDRKFKKSNDILDGKLKSNLREGRSRPTKHKEIIPTSDLMKIAAYLYSRNNPIILRFRVWFILSFHFVTRGLEFQEQLRRDSFVFSTDEHGDEYVTLSHETKQKNWQGGIDSKENQGDKRMYAVPSAGDDCPVQSLRYFLSKTNPSATRLFNRCEKMALSSPEAFDIWYNDIPLKHYNFTRFMSDICKQAGCTTYTAHCLRATAIQGMNDAGFEIRHIMHMSGHKNEASVRSYNRDCSTAQKKAMSETLASLVTGNSPAPAPAPAVLQPRVSAVAPQNREDGDPDALRQANFSQSSNFSSSGFISNSSFANCVFHLNINK